VKVYWDSSAIIFYYARGRIADISGTTRPHSLAEVFSALTGRGFDLLLPDGTTRHKRLSLGLAAQVLSRIHPNLQYVDLSAQEVLSAISQAKAKGAQGGRIHDLLHAAAAEKAGADELWTIDEFDFKGLGKVRPKVLT